MSNADQRRSPRFLYSEVVRVVACTGREVVEGGDPIDASGLVGKELVVGDAAPTVERDGWLIGARGFEETDGWTVWFAEESLESTGLAEDWSKGDRWKWLPIDQCRPRLRGWRATVWVELITDLTQKGKDAKPAERRKADALAEAAAKSLAKLVPTKRKIKWTTGEEGRGEPMSIDLWLEPADALAAYERIVSEPSRAWLHGEDNHGFLCSSWEPPITERLVFLVPGIQQAKVRCEYHSSPERIVPRRARRGGRR